MRMMMSLSPPASSTNPTPAPGPSAVPRWRRFGIGGAALLLAGLLAAGCNHAAPTDKMAKLAEVTVTTPITDEVTDYQDFTGRLDALKTVEIRARVSGYVTQI